MVAFSKLESMRYPSPDQLAHRLDLVLSGADDRALFSLLPDAAP